MKRDWYDCYDIGLFHTGFGGFKIYCDCIREKVLELCFDSNMEGDRSRFKADESLLNEYLNETERWLELLERYDTNIQYHGKIVEDGNKHTEFSVVMSVIVWFEDRICVQTDRYRDLKQYFWVERHEAGCGYVLCPMYDLSAVVQIEIQRAKCFVKAVGDSYKRHEAIWVVVDRLTNRMVHRLLLSQKERSEVYVSFLGKDFRMLGELVLSSIQHFISNDGSVREDFQTLEDMLMACALEWTGSWLDEYLCLWSLPTIIVGMLQHQGDSKAKL
ncbi:hypothetical protein Tco_0077806 [Tanacetum coccineum]